MTHLFTNYNLALAHTAEMEEWKVCTSLGPTEVKENASSPMGKVCSLQYIRCLAFFGI